jgi:hypothetical protein
MASIISAGTTSGTALNMSGDTSGVLQLASNGTTTAMTIDTSQNVGIGTTSPSFPLHIVKSANSDVHAKITNSNAGGSAASAWTASNGTLTSQFGITGASYTSYGILTANSAYIYNTNDISFGADNASGVIKFGTGSGINERMRIDSSGNLQLGYGGAAPTACAAPQGISLVSDASVALQIYFLKQTQVEAHIGFKSSTDTNFYFGTSGGQGAGGIGAYGLYQQNVTNSWTSVSDERLKTELQPVENALEKVANVRTVTGRFTYDEENGVTRRLPFLIAQDFLTALPEAVDRQDPNKLGLSYSDTVVLAFAAIKELKTINDTQAETINALTARIVALETV